MTGGALCILVLEVSAVKSLWHEQRIIMQRGVILIARVLAEEVAFHANRVINVRNDGPDFAEEMLVCLTQSSYFGLNIAFYADTAMTVDAFNLGMCRSRPRGILCAHFMAIIAEVGG